MDLKKTINGQLPSLANPNQLMPPEGDKPVFYSKTGALLLGQRETYGAMTLGFVSTATTARASTAKIISGPYLDASITLDPCVLSPDVFMLNPNLTANRTWTLPTATAFVTYLKSLLGPENVTCNFCWKIYIVNSSASTLTFNTGGTNISVIGGDGGNGVINGYSGGELVFVIVTIIPGTETVYIYIT